MMAPAFVCCVCKTREVSPGALHSHHMNQHTTEELSLALLWSHCLLTQCSPSDPRKEDDILRNSLSKCLVKYPQFLLSSQLPDCTSEKQSNPLIPNHETSASKHVPLSHQNVTPKLDTCEILKSLLKPQRPLNLLTNDCINEPVVCASEFTNPTQNIQAAKFVAKSTPCISYTREEERYYVSRPVRKKQHVNYCEMEQDIIPKNEERLKPETLLCADKNPENIGYRLDDPETKENEGQKLNTIAKKEVNYKQNKWKISLVNRSKAEKKLEEIKANKNPEPHLESYLVTAGNNLNAETSKVKEESSPLPTPDLSKQSPHLYLALLGKRNADTESEEQNDAPPPVKKIRKATQVKRKRAAVKTSPKEKNDCSPESVYNMSILKTPPPSTTSSNDSNVHCGIFEFENVYQSNEEKLSNIQTELLNEESNDSVMSQPPAPSNPFVIASERRFSCSLCACAYKKNSHLVRHMRSHTGERPFACNVCEKRFSVKSVLNQHLRIHTGEKPFVCSVCGARFPQTSGLMTHMMLHTGKPYKCDYCTKSFVSNHKLVHHLGSHSGVRPHSCTKCNLQFFTVSALHEHESRMHLNEKKFFCDICKASFKLEVSLKVHLDGHIQELGGEDIIEQLCAGTTLQENVISEESNTSSSF